jgi:PleD family two-component response regulator
VTITISGGCAAGIAEDGDNLVRRADDGLYQAKAAGRNRIAAVAAPGLTRS